MVALKSFSVSGIGGELPGVRSLDRVVRTPTQNTSCVHHFGNTLCALLFSLTLAQARSLRFGSIFLRLKTYGLKHNIQELTDD